MKKNINLKNLKEKALTLMQKGFFTVVFSSVISNVIIFLGGTILVRILSQDDYGSYSYIMNTINMLFILGDFGACNAILQYASEEYNNEERRNAFITLGIKQGLFFSLIASVLILLSPYFYGFKIENTMALTRILFMLPVMMTLKTFITAVLRARLENKAFAIFNILATLIHYILIVPFALFGGLKGSIYSNYFIYGSVLLIGFYMIRNMYKVGDVNKYISKKEKKEFRKLALSFQVNASISNLLVYIDIFLIGYIVTSASQISVFKVASTLPQAMLFIPTSVVIFVIPYFCRNNTDMKWVNEKFNSLIKYSAILYGLVIGLCYIMAPFLITFLFGQEYVESVQIFRILLIGFFFSATFKINCNNVLTTLRKVNVNIVISIISGIFNIIFDIIFIRKYGIVGAAMTTSVIMIINSILAFTYVKVYLKRRLLEEK